MGISGTGPTRREGDEMMMMMMMIFVGRLSCKIDYVTLIYSIYSIQALKYCLNSIFI